MKLLCSCKHEFQDREHGIGRRVHNMLKKAPPGVPQEYRCTVCGTTRTRGEAKKK